MARKCPGGGYLAFVDSDDEVEPDYCKAMYEKAVRDNNDVVMCRLDHIKYSRGQVKHITYPATFWEEDNFRFADHPELMARMSTMACNKLVRRDLFFRVLFSEDISYAEDHLYVVQLFCLAENIGTEKRILYHYYHIHNGMTSRFGPGRLTRTLAMERIRQFMGEHGLADLFHRELEVLYLRFFENYNILLMPPDGTAWDIRLRFVRQTQAFLRKYCPDWRRNPYYRQAMRKRAKQFRPAYYNYGEGHMLLLMHLSRILPKTLYRQVLRADHALGFVCRWVRWGTIGTAGRKE